MATYLAQASANWDAANQWSADGGSTFGTPGANDTCDLNGKTVTLNVDVTVTAIQASGATGTLTASGTRVINAAINYGGTLTTGMTVIGTGSSLTINGQVSNSSSGYAILVNGTGPLTVSNPGATALSDTGTGRCVHVTGAATVGITGAVSASSGYGLSTATGASTVTITGDVAAASAAVALSLAAGTVTIDGNMSSTGTASPLLVGGATVTWKGTHAVASDKDANISITSGTLNFGASGAGNALALTVAGHMIVRKSGGTFSQTYGTVTLYSTGQAAMVSNSGYMSLTGPVLPDAANVWNGTAQFGYADALVTPTKVASSIANCSAGNVRSGVAIDDVTGSLSLPAIANVWYNIQYGAGGTEYTGTKRASSIANCSAGNVKSGVTIDDVTGNYSGGGGTYPSVTDVWTGVQYGPNGTDYTGTKRASSIANCSAANIRSGTVVDDVTGTLALPAASNVWYNVGYGAGGTEYTGSKRASSIANCSAANVRSGIVIDDVTGTVALPAESAVWYGTGYGTGGTQYTGSKRASSIANCVAGNILENIVIDDVTGTYVCPESSVSESLSDVTLPDASDVRFGIEYGEVGSEVTGTLIVPGTAAGPLVMTEETGANAWDGGVCIKLVPSSETDYGYWFFYIPGTSGTAFTLKFWHKVASGFNGSVRCTIFDADGETLLNDSETVDYTDDGSYHQFIATPATPTATGLCLVRVEVEQGSHGISDAVYIDNVTVIV